MQGLIHNVAALLKQLTQPRRNLLVPCFCCCCNLLVPWLHTGHIARHTAALASTLNIPSADTASGQENLVPGIASSVAAITAAVQKLQPLLQRAQKLRASRQPLSALQNGEDGQVQLCVCCQSDVLYALST